MSTGKIAARRTAVGVLALSVTLGASAAPALAAAKGHAGKHVQAKTLYVSPAGKGTACTKTAPCKTIDAAVAKAKPGARIMVAKGVYREEVMIAKKLWLIGSGHPRIDAKGKGNGVKIAGEGAAGSRVAGFIVEGANFEGILAVSTSHVRISGNVVQGNDLGAHAAHPVGECAPQGPVPGDCGEGLHLMSVTHSRVDRNVVKDNAGGILLTDELGPTAHNEIDRNKVMNNAYDCGITLASHSTTAVAEGKPQPSKGGIYDNLILDNLSNHNGLKSGAGAGVLLAAAAPGGATYENIVKGNTAEGDGMAGVVLHSHAPNQDLNGNQIIKNTLVHDALRGNKGKPGDEDAGVSGTAGIIVFSAVGKLEGVTIAGNTIKDVHYGIWTKNSVKKVSRKANKFVKVTVPVTQM